MSDKTAMLIAGAGNYVGAFAIVLTGVHGNGNAGLALAATVCAAIGTAALLRSTRMAT